MTANTIVNFMFYLIRTNLLICKNDELYQVSPYTKEAFDDFNNDFMSLFI